MGALHFLSCRSKLALKFLSINFFPVADFMAQFACQPGDADGLVIWKWPFSFRTGNKNVETVQTTNNIGEVFVSSVDNVPCMYVRMFVKRDGMQSLLVCMYIRCYNGNPSN